MTEQLPDGMLTERTCPDCGGRMVVKSQRATGHQFLGCERFNLNGCGYTEHIPESFRMKLAGHPVLPGFD